MKVWTFFEDFDWPNNYDTSIVALWSESWHKHGWEPQVLSLKDVGQGRARTRLEEKTKEISGLNRLPYNMMCNLRWLAWARNGGGILVDYDIFNYGFRPTDLVEGDGLTIYCDFPGWGLLQADGPSCYKVVDMILEYDLSYFVDKPWSTAYYTKERYGAAHAGDMIVVQDYYTAKYSVSDPFFKTDLEVRWREGCSFPPKTNKLVHYANDFVGGQENRIIFINEFEKKNGLR